MDTTVQVETPERIRFSFRIAGPAHRAAAYAIDLLVRGGLLTALALLAGVTGALGPGGLGFGVLALGLFLVEWGYYVVSELLTNGQSIGKRSLGLRVVRSDGLPLGFPESLLRNLLRAADFLPFGYAIGVLVSAFSLKFQRLGDLAASTMVVVEKRERVLPAIEIRPRIRAKELQALPMRPDLAEQEVEAIELFLRRSESLTPAREEELAELVAPLFASRMRLRYHEPARFLALLYYRTRGGGT